MGADSEEVGAGEEVEEGVDSEFGVDSGGEELGVDSGGEMDSGGSVLVKTLARRVRWVRRSRVLVKTWDTDVGETAGGCYNEQ